MKFMTTEGKQCRVSEHEPIVTLPMNGQHLIPTYDIPDQKKHILDVEEKHKSVEASIHTYTMKTSMEGEKKNVAEKRKHVAPVELHQLNTSSNSVNRLHQKLMQGFDIHKVLLSVLEIPIHKGSSPGTFKCLRQVVAVSLNTLRLFVRHNEVNQRLIWQSIDIIVDIIHNNCKGLVDMKKSGDESSDAHPLDKAAPPEEELDENSSELKDWQNELNGWCYENVNLLDMVEAHALDLICEIFFDNPEVCDKAAMHPTLFETLRDLCIRRLPDLRCLRVFHILSAFGTPETKAAIVEILSTQTIEGEVECNIPEYRITATTTLEPGAIVEVMNYRGLKDVKKDVKGNTAFRGHILRVNPNEKVYDVEYAEKTNPLIDYYLRYLTSGPHLNFQAMLMSIYAFCCCDAEFWNVYSAISGDKDILRQKDAYLSNINQLQGFIAFDMLQSVILGHMGWNKDESLDIKEHDPSAEEVRVQNSFLRLLTSLYLNSTMLDPSLERQERSQKRKKIHVIIDTLVKEVTNEKSPISDFSDEEYIERRNCAIFPVLFVYFERIHPKIRHPDTPEFTENQDLKNNTFAGLSKLCQQDPLKNSNFATTIEVKLLGNQKPDSLSFQVINRRSSSRSKRNTIAARFGIDESKRLS